MVPRHEKTLLGNNNIEEKYFTFVLRKNILLTNRDFTIEN